MKSIDMAQVNAFGSTMFYLIAAGLLMWLMHRRGVDVVVAKARDEWRSLAEAQDKRIVLMEARIKYLEDENERVQDDIVSKQKTIENLTQINLNLQNRNITLEVEVGTMKARITELEYEVKIGTLPHLDNTASPVV